MTDTLAAVRVSTAQDSLALSNLHRDAWHNAYRGIIPGIALERMIARRGPAWWRGMHETGGYVLVVDWGGEPVGYAMLGRARASARGLGEIYELYLRPDCQGTGLGRRLFEASRRHLREEGRSRLVVWALRENTTACRFYHAMNGVPFARSCDRIGGVRVEKIGYAWA
jgi:GNAT superfamily N-acetyltransferase